MNEDIKFSIHVPVFNSEEYLEECIESILNQTYSNFELFLVDDCSTDNSGAICDRYAAMDPRVIVHHMPQNSGTLAANRWSIDRSTGDWCAFSDCDDWVESTWLEEMVRTIEQYDPDLIMYAHVDFEEDGQTFFRSFSALPQEMCFGGEELQAMFLRAYVPFPLWSKVCKTSIVDMGADYSACGRIDQTQDVVQSMALMKNAKRAVYIDYPFYHFRQHKKSISHNYSEKKIETFRISAQKMRDFATECGGSEELYKAAAMGIMTEFAQMFFCAAYSNCRVRTLRDICRETGESELFAFMLPYFKKIDLPRTRRTIVYLLEKRRYGVMALLLIGYKISR